MSASIATAALRQKGFDAGFVYFGEIDDVGHIFGLAGDEYRDAIRRVDAHVKKVLSEVSRRSDELGEDWLVVTQLIMVTLMRAATAAPPIGSENPGSSRGARTGNCQSGLKKLRRMSWQN